MISKAHALLMIIMMLVMNIAHAETSKTIQFENQREEIFYLENWLKETRYKKETIDTTCYRSEPYTDYVCRNVTRYRQECSTVPGRQECGTVYDRVCRTENRYENECHSVPGEQQCRVVVRYRQECSTSGGGRQCHTVPGNVECRVVNGENRCTKIPPREVCEDRPGQQQCRQVPYEERECSNGPSRQECRQVSRPHEVCENRPRQQCDWVPPREVCSQVPYYEQVCGNETLYRQVPYDCRKEVDVPYEVTLKTHQANVQVLFDSKAADLAPVFTVDLSTKGDVSISAKEEGSKTFALVKKDIKKESQGDVNSIKAIYKVSLLNRADLFNVSEKGITSVDLGKRSLSFTVNGKFEHARSSLSVKIAKKDDVKFEKVLKASQFKSKFDGSVTRVDIDLQSVGAPKLGGIFNKKHQVTLKLKMDYSDVGEVLLPKLGELSVGTSVEAEAD